MKRPVYYLLTFAAISFFAAVSRAADNTPPEGFTALFNGKDLTNWKGLLKGPLDSPAMRAKATPEELARAQVEADENMRQHWRVEDGALVFDGKGRSLATAKDYGDFEMYVDWKILPKGDSGIYLRGTPQVQIWDPEAEKQNAVGSGGVQPFGKGMDGGPVGLPVRGRCDDAQGSIPGFEDLHRRQRWCGNGGHVRRLPLWRPGPGRAGRW